MAFARDVPALQTEFKYKVIPAESGATAHTAMAMMTAPPSAGEVLSVVEPHLGGFRASFARA